MEFPFSKSSFDLPFDPDGVGYRLIKSHTLATKLHSYRDYRIIMVYRNAYECWRWWNEAGGFKIKYPNYSWYMNQNNMFHEIQKQNYGIMKFIYNHKETIKELKDNISLLDALGMSTTGVEFVEEYEKKDVKVYLYEPAL
jgi:hypothetical protein